MRQGTTPVHTFTLPFSVPTGAIVRVIYAQKINGSKVVLFVKTGATCAVNGNTVRVNLSQEETFLFQEQNDALIQIRVLLTTGEVVESNIMRTTVKECLETEILCFEGESV